MKNARTLTILVVTLWLLFLASASQAGPMGTAFTYQGHLYDANYAANGSYDFAFKLYDANAGGSKVGTDVNASDVDVIDAYFTVELDFNDANTFNGEARWLEIGVRPGDMNDPNGYTTLSPRQEVTPTPYALYAENASTDSDWTIIGNNMYSNVTGNVGIGVKSPTKKLDVAGHINASEYYYVNNNVFMLNPSGTGDFYYGWDLDVKKHILATNGIERLVINDLGNVGIGTTSPRGIFDVDADGDDIYLDTWTAQIYLGDVDGDGDNVLLTIDESAGKFTFENGDVGIGTMNPTTPLDVNGTAKATAFVGDGSGLTNLPATPDSDWTISGSDMYSAVAGNVGIGTTSPSYKLDVDGSARVTGTLNSATDLKIATDDGAEIAIGYDIVQFDRKLYVYTDSDAYGIYTYNQDTSGLDRYAFYGLSMEDTTGDSYGILGRSLNATGDNYGAYGWATSPSSGNNYGVYGQGSNAGAGDGFAGYFDGKVYTSGDVGIGTENPSGILEVSHDGSSHDLVVDANGKVGIGTNSPAQKLHIQHSSVGSMAVKIENTATTNSLGLSVETNSSDASGAFRVLSSGSNILYVSNLGRVGIGATNPTNELGINGAAAIGSNYAITKTAPANGLLVQGAVGIGTYTPARMLHVSDTMRLEPRATAPSSPSEGDIYMNSTTHKLMVYDGTTWQACW